MELPREKMQAAENEDAKKTIPEWSTYNVSFLRRHAVVWACKLLRKIPPNRGARVVMLSKKLCIKTGPKSFTLLAEASAMRFVKENTSVPVPEVYCAFEHKGRTYILMERIRGDWIARGWSKRTEASKAKLHAQLRGMIEEIRKIPAPPGAGVMNVDGGPIWDCRLPKKFLYGPYRIIDDFHIGLRQGLEDDGEPWPEEPDMENLLKLYARPWGPITFTHGDLSSFNIICHGEEITGIVDWATAGWYPAYWEYTRACLVSPLNAWWRKEIEKFVEPNSEALEMERLRQKFWMDL